MDVCIWKCRDLMESMWFVPNTRDLKLLHVTQIFSLPAFPLYSYNKSLIADSHMDLFHLFETYLNVSI